MSTVAAAEATATYSGGLAWPSPSNLLRALQAEHSRRRRWRWLGCAAVPWLCTARCLAHGVPALLAGIPQRGTAPGVNARQTCRHKAAAAARALSLHFPQHTYLIVQTIHMQHEHDGCYESSSTAGAWPSPSYPPLCPASRVQRPPPRNLRCPSAC